MLRARSAHNHPRRNVRLDTLVRLRWLAIIGQTTAVLVVYFGLEFELPIWSCLAVIVLSAWLNVALRLRFHIHTAAGARPRGLAARLRHRRIGRAPVSDRRHAKSVRVLFLGPVLLSATALPPRFTLMLGGFAIACATVLVFVHYPLP